jgi:hypothetical protein
MSLRGNLKTMSVADLLQFLEVSQKTGVLKIGNRQINKQIYFEKGMIVCSTSNDPRELFGQFLLHRGKLEESQLRQALAIHIRTEERLGRVLISSGILTEVEVVDLLRNRNTESIYDLFLWPEAHFEFHEGEECPKDLIPVAIKPSTVVMEGIYRLDEWNRFRKLIPSDQSILSLASDCKFTEANFPPETPRILYFIKKKVTVGEIILQMHASPFHIYACLYELLSRGFIHMEGELPAPPPPARIPSISTPVPQLLLNISGLIQAGKAEEALQSLQPVLEEEPNNEAAQTLRLQAENKILQQFYQSGLTPGSVLYISVSPDVMVHLTLNQQEAFILSRINNSWDIQSILSICPFRKVESILIIRRLLEKGLIRV